jgi:hypothetical protein
MKKIILLMGIFFMSCISYCTTPPEAVLNAFNKQFVNATGVKWDKENASEFEAEFVLNGTKISANYSVDGTWLETETDLKAELLPVKVKEFISKTYPSWKIVGAAKIETLKRGTFYEADLKSGTKKKEITLTAEAIPVK